MVGHAGSTTGIVDADVTLTRSKVKIKVTGLLNFRQLAKPCMLATMTVSPLAGLSGILCAHLRYIYVITGSAVALHCCKGHSKINRKMENSTPCKMVTPESYILKLGTRDYVVMSCMRVCRKQALSRVKYYYYVTNSKI